MLPLKNRDIWWIKLDTWLSKQEENFLKKYKKLSTTQRIQYFDRYEYICWKIESYKRDFKAEIQRILNEIKGMNGRNRIFLKNF